MMSQRRKKNGVIYAVRYRAANAAYHFLSAFGLFFGIVLLTGFFILFQWKNVEIRSHLADIDKLHQEILALNSEVSRLETARNELIKNVPDLAQSKLKMVTPREAPAKLYLDGRKLAKYEEK